MSEVAKEYGGFPGGNGDRESSRLRAKTLEREREREERERERAGQITRKRV